MNWETCFWLLFGVGVLAVAMRGAYAIGIDVGKRAETDETRDQRVRAFDEEYRRGYNNGRTDTFNRVNHAMKGLVDPVARP